MADATNGDQMPDAALAGKGSELLELILNSLENDKAEEIVHVDLR